MAGERREWTEVTRFSTLTSQSLHTVNDSPLAQSPSWARGSLSYPRLRGQCDPGGKGRGGGGNTSHRGCTCKVPPFPLWYKGI